MPLITTSAIGFQRTNILQRTLLIDVEYIDFAVIDIEMAWLQGEFWAILLNDWGETVWMNQWIKTDNLKFKWCSSDSESGLSDGESMRERSVSIKLTLKRDDFGKIVGVPLIDSSVFTASKEKMSFRNEAKSQYRILMKINFELSRITSKAPFLVADNS